MSIGLSLNAAKMLPWGESNDLGYGATLTYQFAFDYSYSLLLAFSYNYIGEDRHVSRYPDLVPTTIKVSDFPFQIGFKRYFLTLPNRPFFTITCDSHNLRKKYNYPDNIDAGLEPGISASIGLEKQIHARYFLSSEVCMHAFQYYSYPVFRLGIRYHIKDSH